MQNERKSIPSEAEKRLERIVERLPSEKRYGTYIAVWLGIILLTGLTYAVSQMSAQGGHVVASLFIAGIQSGLALTYFMHLGSERDRIFKVIIPLVLAVMLVFIGLTFSDVAFRRQP
jgi:cytochrome c oxidase subunit 4